MPYGSLSVNAALVQNDYLVIISLLWCFYDSISGSVIATFLVSPSQSQSDGEKLK